MLTLFIFYHVLFLQFVSGYYLTPHHHRHNAYFSKYAGIHHKKTSVNGAINFNIELLSEQNKIGVKNDVMWSDSEEKFVIAGDYNKQQKMSSESVTATQKPVLYLSSLNYFLRTCFIPSGDLTKYYFSYTYWRLGQRFISATNSVFGTQALLLALGFKKNQIGIYIYIFSYRI